MNAFGDLSSSPSTPYRWGGAAWSPRVVCGLWGAPLDQTGFSDKSSPQDCIMSWDQPFLY